MTSFLVFLKAIPGKLWGYIGAVAGMIAFLAYFYFSAKNKGKIEAEKKAEVKEARAAEARADIVTKTVIDDAKVIVEVKKEIDALPPSDLVDRASQWVRNKP